MPLFAQAHVHRIGSSCCGVRVGQVAHVYPGVCGSTVVNVDSNDPVKKILQYT